MDIDIGDKDQKLFIQAFAGKKRSLIFHFKNVKNSLNKHFSGPTKLYRCLEQYRKNCVSEIVSITILKRPKSNDSNLSHLNELIFDHFVTERHNDTNLRLIFLSRTASALSQSQLSRMLTTQQKIGRKKSKPNYLQ